MTESKISVIVPVYNTEAYLKECIESILKQTYANIELILVDDGSTDGSGRICDAYARADSRVKAIHKTNGGQSAARNMGLDLAQGTYIGFVDSDDYIAPEAYETMIRLMEGKRNRIVSSLVMYADEKGTPIAGHYMGKQADDVVLGRVYLRELLLMQSDMSTCNKLFPKQLIAGHRFAEGRLNEDFLFLLDLLPGVEEVVSSTSVGYYYRVRKGSTSTGYSRATEDIVVNAQYAAKLVKESFPELESEALRFLWRQRMVYMLLAPRRLAGKKNTRFYEIQKVFREKYFSECVPNAYISKAEKLVIAGQCVCPEWVAFAYKHFRARR